MNVQTLSGFPVFLNAMAYEIAEEFYRQQSNPEKAKEVYLNTLAVYAVDYYLNCLNIETDLEASDSWDIVMQTLSNVADLVIKDYGRIECRIVLPDADTCSIPGEVWSDRIGYVAVQLNQELTEAKLIGFLETVNTEEVILSNFQPIEELIDKLSQPIGGTITSGVVTQITQFLTVQKLSHKIVDNWRELTSLINPQLQVAVRTRNNLVFPKQSEWIEKGKNIKLSSLREPLILGFAFQPTEGRELIISIELYPFSGHKYLPQGIEMQILDETGKSLMQANTNEISPYLRFSFLANIGDSFSAKITFEGVFFVENFMV
ncbi:DUF1822 family protein [Aphanothece sacrum]|uniref:DUF1822 family protein n=1 Tax=Aphanothece sacrum FPU1 TaxID=1920663 RepID=A0A401IL85_APHSA|nr:DUF1822 family protein [Aphanothece sacrum]GBF82019.1 hypothetical protein AsFPU1_3442 [Aphanothece sacrum FPU1]GBF85836.1 hypothetical protein AsFPU3_2903 [Aphanothece sacrum FPU3]